MNDAYLRMSHVGSMRETIRRQVRRLQPSLPLVETRPYLREVAITVVEIRDNA